jgi:hypothetical protein
LIILLLQDEPHISQCLRKPLLREFHVYWRVHPDFAAINIHKGNQKFIDADEFRPAKLGVGLKGVSV